MSVKYLDQERRAPIPCLLLEHRHKRPALDVGARFEPGDLEQSRSDIEAQDHLGRRRARRRQRWIADDERNADRLFVGQTPLFIESVFAVEIPVVAGKHDHRVVQYALALEGGEDPPRLSSTASSISRRPLISSSDVAVFGPSGGSSINLAKQRRLPKRRLERVRPARHGATDVATAVALGGHEASWLIRDWHQTPIVTLNDIGMDGLVSQVHEERTIRRTVEINESLDIVGEQVGRVTLRVYPLAVDIQRGVDRFALSRHGDPVVESRARTVVVAHVPLAEEAGAVARALKLQREHRQAVAWSSGVVDDAVGVRVLAREKARPAGRTERRRGERVREARPFAREPVHVRRVDERMAGDPHLIPAHVVDEHHDDVRSARLGGRRSIPGLAWRRTRGCEERGHADQ